MNWNTVRLADVSKIQTGKSNKEDAVAGGEYAFFDRSQTEQRSSRFLFDTEAIIVPGEGKEFIPRYFVGKFDLHQRVYAITDFNGVNGKFLYYSILQNKNYFSQVAIGTTVKSLRKGMFERLELKAPSLHEQSQIAAVLSNYDSLIENNRKQIVLLEKSARLLYREWFGNQRNLRATSPAHKTLPTKPLVEIANLTMGQSPASKHYNKDGEGLPFHQGATSYRARFVEDKVYSTHTTKIAMPGDILLSVRAPVGRINITQNKIVLGRGLAAINSKAGFNSFLFYALKSFFFKEDIIGTGSIYAAVTKSQLEKVEIFYPPEEKIKRFESVVVPIDRKISNLYRQIQLLTKARDLLLPRLMDGRIKP